MPKIRIRVADFESGFKSSTGSSWQLRWCACQMINSSRPCLVAKAESLQISLKIINNLVSAREASWRRAFDPCAPLLFNLYHYLEQNLHFGSVTENQL